MDNVYLWVRIIFNLNFYRLVSVVKLWKIYVVLFVFMGMFFKKDVEGYFFEIIFLGEL